MAPRDARVRWALAVGGGGLLSALERSTPGSKDAPDLEGKLLRYLIRMSTRPTPYGLFAGVALAEWGSRTDLSLAPAPPLTRTRLDMGWLLTQVMALEAQAEVRRHLKLFANAAHFIYGGRVYLSEQAPQGDGGAQAAVSLRATGVVRRALELAREPIPYADLVERLLEDTPGATREKVERLITELWQRTLLLTDLRPPLTNPQPALYVARKLADIPAAQETLGKLNAVIQQAASWDALPLEESVEGYRQLLSRASELSRPAAARDSAGRPDAETPLQVDMAIPLAGRQLHWQIGAEVARAAELLLRLTPSPRGFAHLAEYRKAFEARYGYDREVPLLEMLDPHFGLGPAHLHRGAADFGVDPEKVERRARKLLDLACNALRDGLRVVELNEEDLTQLETWKPAPGAAPPSLDINAFIAASTHEALDAGNFEVVVGPNLGASTAGCNLGRFADLLAPDAVHALASVARAEQSQSADSIRAELVYLSRKFRSANVVVRPAVREHECPLAVSPGVPSANVIPLNELVVGIRDDRFYVRWPRAGVEAISCAGHMLNNRNAPAVMRFLSEVSEDGVAQLISFDWGPAEGFPFLPRVQAGRVVLRCAEWRVDALTRTRELSPEPADGFTARLERWRVRWLVPRYVYLSRGDDNRLLLDLDNTRQVEELRGELRGLRGSESIILQEALPGPYQVWLPGADGHFMLEIVASLMLREKAHKPAEVSETAPASPEPSSSVNRGPQITQEPPLSLRLRAPGSDWLFAKLYCADALEEDLIAGPVRHFAEEALDAGLAHAWFFIRYSDPEPHVRLRFRGTPDRLTRELLPELCVWAQRLMDERLCLRFGFDTYDRELERYGGPDGLEIAEAIFAADSRAVAQLLHQYQNHELHLDRTDLAVLTIDDLLAGLGLGADARLGWCREQLSSTKNVSTEYRRRKELLRALLSDRSRLQSEPGGAAAEAILNARRSALAPLAARLEEWAGCENRRSLPGFYASILHMHCNRLLGRDHSSEGQALGLFFRTRDGLAHAVREPHANAEP